MALIKHIDWSDLNDLYLEKKLSLGEIAIKKGCTKQNLQKIMAHRGIPRRTLKEQIRIYWDRHGKDRVWKKGAEHHAWRGGIAHSSTGYTLLYKPDHPRANGDGYVAEHVLVWENTHNQPVPHKHVIHHLNGIRGDNRPENLQVLPIGSHHG